MEDCTIFIKQLIRHYELYQYEAINNIENIFKSFERKDLKQAQAWRNIMNYWYAINDGFKVNYLNESSELENVAKDDSVVISILGIKLNDDGSMNEELIQRLEVGLRLAQSYPNAFLSVTGGPTAKDNPNVTEGGQMAKWLIEKGVNEDRIIVESRAADTVGNAVYTYEILQEKYPQVTSIVLVSSDYHVSRGCLLYYSTMVLAALKAGGKQLEIVSNAATKTNNLGYETIALQAWSVCQVAGINYEKLNNELE